MDGSEIVRYVALRLRVISNIESPACNNLGQTGDAMSPALRSWKQHVASAEHAGARKATAVLLSGNIGPWQASLPPAGYLHALNLVPLQLPHVGRLSD